MNNFILGIAFFFSILPIHSSEASGLSITIRLQQPTTLQSQDPDLHPVIQIVSVSPISISLRPPSQQSQSSDVSFLRNSENIPGFTVTLNMGDGPINPVALQNAFQSNPIHEAAEREAYRYAVENIGSINSQIQNIANQANGSAENYNNVLAAQNYINAQASEQMARAVSLSSENIPQYALPTDPELARQALTKLETLDRALMDHITDPLAQLDDIRKARREALESLTGRSDIPSATGRAVLNGINATLTDSRGILRDFPYTRDLNQVRLLSNQSSTIGQDIRAGINTVLLAESNIGTICHQEVENVQLQSNCSRFGKLTDDMMMGYMLADRLASIADHERALALLNSLNPMENLLRGFVRGVYVSGKNAVDGITALLTHPDKQALLESLAVAFGHAIVNLPTIKTSIENFLGEKLDVFQNGSAEEIGEMLGGFAFEIGSNLIPVNRLVSGFVSMARTAGIVTDIGSVANKAIRAEVAIEYSIQRLGPRLTTEAGLSELVQQTAFRSEEASYYLTRAMSSESAQYTMESMPALLDEFVDVNSRMNQVIGRVESNIPEIRAVELRHYINPEDAFARGFDPHIGNLAANHRFSMPGRLATYSVIGSEIADPIAYAAAVAESGMAESVLAPSMRMASYRNVLDLTDDSVRRILGLRLEDLTLPRGNGFAGYNSTHILGEAARAHGFDAIKVPSAVYPGAVNLISW